MMKAIGRKNEGKPRDTDEVMEAQPLIVHLMALRKVIIICLAAVVVLFLIVFFGFSSRLVQYVSDPLAGQGVQVIYTEVSEAFGAQTKLSLIAGVVLASPVIFAAVWWFVRPALTPKERVSALGYLMTAVFLFFFGVLFAYRFVFFSGDQFFCHNGGCYGSPYVFARQVYRFFICFSGSLRDHVRAACRSDLACETWPYHGVTAKKSEKILYFGHFYNSGDSDTAGCGFPVYAGVSAFGAV